MKSNLARRITAEAVRTGFLLASVVGSGSMAERPALFRRVRDQIKDRLLEFLETHPTSSTTKAPRATTPKKKQPAR